MRTIKSCRYLLMLALVASFAGFGTTALGEEKTQGDAAKQVMDMPVLTGKLWQMMTQDGKIAFIWGVGHVVTIEKHVVERHPELKRSDFTAKLSEGLTGVPMNTIVTQIDTYYKEHPQDLDLPVMKVIWREMVKPKLTLGIADQPINREPEHK